MNRIARVPSYAKINLGLRILRRRDDGYHEIETIFQQIALHDTLAFEELSEKADPCIDLIVTPPILPSNSTNLVQRAARAFMAQAGVSLALRIKLTKRIPIGAGLGGGSSNAATTLAVLNFLLGEPLDETRLLELAASLGADVAFFLRGGTALGQGIGDQITPLPELEKAPILVVAPPLPVSTAWAYANLKIPLTNNENNSTLTRFFERGYLSVERLQDHVNDFEPLIFDTYSALKEIKQELLKLHAAYVSLSGSGSALYAIFRNERDARIGYNAFRPHYPTFLTQPISWGMRELGKSLAQNG